MTLTRCRSARSQNISGTPVTTTDFLGTLKTYTPPVDNPGCVPMIKTAATASYLADTTSLWGSPANKWPHTRGIAITGTFGAPPHGT